MEGKYDQKKQYNKLVRDKIPEFLVNKGKEYKAHTAEEKEYEKKLLEKLIEEAQEFSENPSAEELADIWEIIEAIMNHFKLDHGEVMKIKEKKKQERGGFEKRIILDEA